jgi:hypothetical protein
VTNYARGGIVGQTHSQALLGLFAAIGNGDKSSVLTVSHTDATTVVKAHPSSSTGYACREVE